MFPSQELRQGLCRETTQDQKAAIDRGIPERRSRDRLDVAHPASVAAISGNKSCAIRLARE